LISPSVFPPAAEGYGMAVLVFSVLAAVVLNRVSYNPVKSFPQQYVPANDTETSDVNLLPKAFAVLDKMKYYIVFWLSLCGIALLIVEITFMVYPQVLASQGFPEDSNKVLVGLAFISLMFLFSLGPFGIVLLIFDFIRRYNRE
jgi:hypothetical protein